MSVLAEFCETNVDTEKITAATSMNTMLAMSASQLRNIDSSLRSSPLAFTLRRIEPDTRQSTMARSESISACTITPVGLLNRYFVMTSRLSMPPYITTVFNMIRPLAAKDSATHVTTTSTARIAPAWTRRPTNENKNPDTTPKKVNSRNVFNGVMK